MLCYALFQVVSAPDSPATTSADSSPGKPAEQDRLVYAVFIKPVAW